MTNTSFALLPDDEDVAFYRESGYWVSPPVLTDDALDAAERGMRRHYAGDVDHEVPGDPEGKLWGWRSSDGDVLRKNDHASLRVADLALLVRQSFISAAAARLAGAKEIRLWHDQLLYKPSGSTRPGNVGWHTDRQYWRSCSSEEMLTAWVPFHDVTDDHGPLMFAAGSHRWNEQPDLSFFDQDLTTIERHADEHDLRIVSVTLTRGQISFHHSKTLHGSGPNHSGEARRSIAIHLQPGDNRHATVHHPDGTRAGHHLDLLVAARPDGAPDYTDPALCPRLWPAAG
ncbi:Phytanoyl-CoA dioxygenase [Streptomyces venezuelae]|uniref:phytanoyl-CoA dioxygenase family protein n=1 Tax=Streptomyces gardneri TaxID=66892 RepID=UPI0006BC58A7|nr:phytanoyl-CoA dioxygenase family protein [Streptomyces gardneri]ALO06100.1 Phytanoyl-CoA dioxygenase [Streptomyces venezuelae]QPK43585.1 phytanoyl-CoA dioxygenase family protein [Streptomyces gardneri]WRK34829.1 phytanoyl-CoA dioxygenase family protein [Streptomyces venezuelae]CUM43664.1 Phytanoyl-CoA dioxygenase [Streptomyces venezuelae]